MYRFLILFLFCIVSFASLGGEPANEQNEEKETSDFSWDLAADIALVQGGSIISGSKETNIGDWLNVHLLLDIRYKRFFIENNHARFSDRSLGAAMGYHLIEEGEWQLDIIHATYMAGFSEESVGLKFDEQIPELQGIDERDFDANTGFRFTRTKKDSQLWFDVVADVFDDTHNGWIVEGYYSVVKPYRNWDIYLGTGINFYSSEVTNYYYGVRPHETTPTRKEYTPGSGFKVMAEIVGQYPLSESWLFNVGLSISHHSPSIAKSPITRGQHLIQGMIIFRYVF